VVSFTFVVVVSCWSSSGDIESSVLLLLHARTHLKHKKKIAPVIRVVVLTRKVVTTFHIHRTTLCGESYERIHLSQPTMPHDLHLFLKKPSIDPLLLPCRSFIL
jgi:hypothetical protein